MDWDDDDERVTIEEDPENLARPANHLAIRLGEHWAVIGKTGSGKTYFTMRGLLRYYREHFPHAKRYVLDSTNDPKMLAHIPDAVQVSGNVPPDLLRSSKQTLVWTPKNSKLPEAYARWFARLNDCHEECIIVIDERKSITKQAEDEFEALLMQIRKHGGTVIVLGQSIAGLDSDLFRQLTHYAQFRLNREIYDSAQTRAYLDISKEEQHPPRFQHGFFYRRTDGDFPHKEYKDMREFFNESLT